MKEFEKHFGVPHGGFEDCDDWKYLGLEEGWKEALEWILYMFKKNNDRFNYERENGLEHSHGIEVKKEIKKELEQ